MNTIESTCFESAIQTGNKGNRINFLDHFDTPKGNVFLAVTAHCEDFKTAIELTVSSFCEEFTSNKFEDIQQSISHSVLYANEQLFSYNVTYPNEKLFVDFACFLVQEDYIYFFSSNQKLAWKYESGKLASMNKSSSNYLGKEAWNLLEVQKIPAHQGDTFMICAANTFNYFDFSQIEKVLKNEESLKIKTENLNSQADNMILESNFVVAIIRFHTSRHIHTNIFEKFNPFRKMENTHNNNEELQPKIPTNLLVFLVVSALIIAFSIYYISGSKPNDQMADADGQEVIDGGETITDDQLADSETTANSDASTSDESSSEDAIDSESTSSSSADEISDEEVKSMADLKKDMSSDNSEKVVKKETKKTTPKKNTKKETTTKSSIAGLNHTHTVKKNESLSVLADMYNMPSGDIKKMNGLSSDNIKPGMKLKVKISKEHKVKSGEQLAVIAKKYNVSTGTLIKVNNLSKSGSIKENQKLLIPLKRS